jgi:hypothetical protein
MKILFLCGSVEPGKDGVGDYTRRLAGELIRKGHRAVILSLCDKHVNCLLSETQISEETPVKVWRIPKATHYNQRLPITQEIVKEVAPDWISLQFVPYGFDSKGLPFWLLRFLKQLKGFHQWHIMFHELWLGIEKESSLKNKFIGCVQLKLIKFMMTSLSFIVIHTQSKLHLHYLNKHKIATSLLPLFGNIPVLKMTKQTEAEAELQLVIFGTIHHGALISLVDFIVDAKKMMKANSRTYKFIFIGRNGTSINNLIQKLQEHTISFDIMGELNEIEISKHLSKAFYGISTTPYKISEKSGAIAAMKEHGLNVLCVSKEWTDNDKVYINHPGVFSYKKGLIEFNIASNSTNNLATITTQFITSIDR